MVSRADMFVDYASVDLGGNTYLCPRRSYSLIAAHLMKQGDTQSRTNYRGEPKFFINRTEFTGYHRFGSEVKIVP
jgi:hypothetical protein